MGFEPTKSIARALLLATVVLPVTGCLSMPHADVVNRSPGVTPTEEVQFYRKLDDVRLVSNADAVYAMTLYAAHDAPGFAGGDYLTQVATLKAHDLLPAGFEGQPDVAADRGTVARFVAVALKLPRGLTASIVGLNGRYALRELEFRGLLPPSSPNQALSGPELIGVLSRAEDFAEAAAAPAPGIAVPPAEKDRPGATPSTPDPTAGRPLPDITLVSRSLDDLILSMDLPAPTTTAVPKGDVYTFTEATPDGVFIYPAGQDTPVPVKPGMTAGGDTEIHTVKKGTAKLIGPHGEVVTIGKYARNTIKTFNTGNVAVTRVALQRGEVGAQVDHPPTENTAIEGAGQVYDLQVQSGRSTLAIKGTRVALYDQRPYDVEARSFTGTAVFEDQQRRKVSFGTKGGGLVTVKGQQPDPTGVALATATEDPSIRNARSASEANLVANYFSRNSPVVVNRFSGLLTVFGGRIPTTTAQFTQFFKNPALVLAITWDRPTNVNIEVLQPDSRAAHPIIYPFLSLAGSGGTIPFDNRGGKHGGFEVVSITDPKPNDVYDLIAQNVGKTATNVSFHAFIGGKPVPFDNNHVGRAVDVPTARVSGGTGAAGGGVTYQPSGTPNGGFPGTLPDPDHPTQGGVVLPAETARKVATPPSLGPVAPSVRSSRR